MLTEDRRVTRDALDDGLRRSRLLAVVRARGGRPALEPCRFLIGAGIRLLEVTADSTGALSAVEQIRRDHGDVLIGVGTVLDAETARRAIGTGAQFLVTPAVRKPVARIAEAERVGLIQGAFTATEILDAWDEGCAACKIFPASLGGADYIRQLRAPLPQIPLIPMGGISLANVRGFLDAGAVAVGVGAALVEDAAGGPQGVAAWLDAVRP